MRLNKPSRLGNSAKQSTINKLSTVSLLTVLLTASLVGCTSDSGGVETGTEQGFVDINETRTVPIEDEELNSESEEAGDSYIYSEEPELSEESGDSWTLEWDSYEIVDQNKINFTFLPDANDPECSSEKVAISVKETSTTIDPEFVAHIPDDPRECGPNYDWSTVITLKAPVGDREVIQ